MFYKVVLTIVFTVSELAYYFYDMQW